MVRNLYSLKIFSFLPGLSWVNNTGEPSLHRTRIHRIRSRGERISSPAPEMMISNSLFIHFRYILSSCRLFSEASSDDPDDTIHIFIRVLDIAWQTEASVKDIRSYAAAVLFGDIIIFCKDRL